MANVGGNFYAINNTCIHRGGPLGQGDAGWNCGDLPVARMEFDVTDR